MHPACGPIGLAEAIMEIGRKGLTIQRLQGPRRDESGAALETTLEPEVRSLLQVKISHADEAEEIFSTLMADVVEPHREFIQQNALNVPNLDV